MSGSSANNEHKVVQALKARRARLRPPNALCTHAANLLEQHKALQAEAQRAQQTAKLADKEKHDMSADLVLLRENEANAGVSKTHIEVLQQQLELAKSEAARLARELADAQQRASASAETAEGLTDKVAALSEQLHVAREEVARQHARAEKECERAGAMQEENAQLMERCVELQARQAEWFDSEISRQETRLRDASLEAG